ncbi:MULTISPECIES: integrase [unclassified Sphingomonas]|uniref:tyrosine-type recombinase/integrase n=1 Tax=unclassified Sphingomonas TaxID=196159 RepID=UPI00226AEEA8|nr:MULTISPECIES: integrase [unclassified Sphingomonas]
MALKFTRLTRPAIRALTPGEKLAEHGIVAARQGNGDLRYTVNIMVDGQRIHRVVGRESEGVTREQAERAIESFRTKAREGRLDLPAGRKNHRTFAEAATEYLQRMEDTGGKNMKEKRRHIPDVLVPFFGKHRADKITSFLVQHYVRDRLKAVKQATVNRELATLSHAFKRMIEWKWLKAEDCPKIEKGDEPRKKIVVLSDEHAAALMKAAVADQDGYLWLFVAFGLNTAMRHSEILRVRYDQIDYDARRIFIPEAKAGEREQPITPALVDMLKRQQAMEPESQEWVFPCRTRRAKLPHRNSMADSFQRAVIRANLLPDKVTPHVMRHTAITRLVRAGVDLPTIQRISGHKTLAMVLRYVHIHGQHIDTAIAAIDNAFADAFTPRLHTPSTPTANQPARVVAIIAANSAA